MTIGEVVRSAFAGGAIQIGSVIRVLAAHVMAQRPVLTIGALNMVEAKKKVFCDFRVFDM